MSPSTWTISELAREFDVSTIAIRDYLNRFTRFGLVEKRTNSGWVIRGFTKEFALELFEVRELFELRSARVPFCPWTRSMRRWRAAPWPPVPTSSMTCQAAPWTATCTRL